MTFGITLHLEFLINIFRDLFVCEETFPFLWHYSKIKKFIYVQLSDALIEVLTRYCVKGAMPTFFEF